MKLAAIMTGGIETITPYASLAEAAKKMASQDIGSLPVCDEPRRVVGIITDRDITVRAVARGMDPNHTRVEDVMTRDVLSCSSEAEVEDACELMEKRQVRRLLVTGQDEVPVGIVSLGDIALCLRESQSGEVLKKVGYTFDVAHTSVLKRAIRTLWTVLDEMDHTVLCSPTPCEIAIPKDRVALGLVSIELAGRPSASAFLRW